MVIDTSALVCIVLEEPEAAAFASAIFEDSIRLVSVVSLVEAGIVLEKALGRAGSKELEFAIRTLKLSIQPVTVDQGQTALLAHWRYGRGLHRAALNFGDCFTYALAKRTNEPLLFKGNDFGRTDLRLVALS